MIISNEQITTKGNQICLINVNQNIKFYFHAKIFFFKSSEHIYTEPNLVTSQRCNTANCVTTGKNFQIEYTCKATGLIL